MYHDTRCTLRSSSWLSEPPPFHVNPLGLLTSTVHSDHPRYLDTHRYYTGALAWTSDSSAQDFFLHPSSSYTKRKQPSNFFNPVSLALLTAHGIIVLGSSVCLLHTSHTSTYHKQSPPQTRRRHHQRCKRQPRFFLVTKVPSRRYSNHEPIIQPLGTQWRHSSAAFRFACATASMVLRMMEGSYYILLNVALLAYITARRLLAHTEFRESFPIAQDLARKDDATSSAIPFRLPAVSFKFSGLSSLPRFSDASLSRTRSPSQWSRRLPLFETQ